MIYGIIDIRILAEHDSSLGLLRAYKRWDWDYRSFPEKPDVASPPDGIDTI
jgi:hypothetical protein